MTDEEESNVSYVLVGNIPSRFHSVDLRSFFSQFIEAGKFECFHFRHRPEVLKRNEVSDNLCEESCSSLKGKTTCCVVRLKEDYVEELLQGYNSENWVDKNGKLSSIKAIISRITIKDNETSNNDIYQTKKEKKNQKRECLEFVKEDLRKLSELRPPSFLPNGNIGTSLKTFLNLIRTCQLPPQVIKKLGLTFPSGRSNRRYGNVALEYDASYKGDVLLCPELTQKDKIENKDLRDFVEPSSRPYNVKHNLEESDQREDNCSEDSESEPEEDWERHEALYDDVDCQGRTKERLFENKIELKWEKGGSGLVFYTDAVYWDSLNGDFDEQTADDWDVDMSVYEKGGTGDRHSQALLQMRIEEQRWSGVDLPEDNTPRKMGRFEKHTKGFGGSLMKKQGWKEGCSLGGSQPGITEPIPNDGQHPRCKKGLGYYGEKLDRNVKRQRVDKDVVISTIFDNPANEKLSTPYQNAGPFTLKYRKKVDFVPQKKQTLKQCR